METIKSALRMVAAMLRELCRIPEHGAEAERQFRRLRRAAHAPISISAGQFTRSERGRIGPERRASGRDLAVTRRA